MTVLDSLVLRSPWQTLVVTRSVMPMRAAHMRPTGGADLRAALDAIIAANAASALEISAFWLSLGGQAISVLRTTELVAAIAGAVEAGRLRAFVFREPAYVCQSDFQSLRAKAELAVRQTGTGGLRAPAPARTVEDMEVAERFVEVFRRAIPRVGPELGRQLRELVENPAQLALMVGTIVILAQLHAVAAGEVIDGIVLAAIIACAALEGMSALEALAAALETVGHLVNFIVMTLRARDEPDLDRAAEMLAAGLSLVGVTLITATFERIAGRFTDSLKRIGRQRKIETVSKEDVAARGAGPGAKRNAAPKAGAGSAGPPPASSTSLKDRVLAAQHGSKDDIEAVRNDILKLGDEDKLALFKEVIEALDVSTEKDTAVLYSGAIIVRDSLGGDGNPALLAGGRRVMKAREFAESAAHAKNKKTLEMTPGGRLLDRLRLYPSSDDPNPMFKQGHFAPRVDALWRRLSGRYTQGASGEVEVILCNPNPDAVYMTVEKPILLNKSDAILKERHLDDLLQLHGM